MIIKLLPVRNKYIARSEVENQLNIFVFESGAWINVEVGFIVPSKLTEWYLVARFHGSFLSLFLIDLKRMKNAWANPNTIKNKTTKNGKTFLATPIIIAKYFPNDWNTRKNNKNLKFNNKLEIAVIQMDEVL